MKSKWRGALIGGVVGIILFLYTDNFCIRYSIREQIYSSFMTCWGIQGSSCCSLSLNSLLFNALFFLVIPILLALLIQKILNKFKK